MKRSFSALTPAALVAMAFPVLFLLVPDGLPFVYAVCGGGAGTATNPTVQFCRSCADNDPLENDSITVSSCSVSGSYNYCALTGQVTLSIATIDACDVEWTANCSNQGGFCAGYPSFALSGPATNQTISHTLHCNGDGEIITLELQGKANCKCASSNGDTRVFGGSATCDRSG